MPILSNSELPPSCAIRGTRCTLHSTANTDGTIFYAIGQLFFLLLKFSTIAKSFRLETLAIDASHAQAAAVLDVCAGSVSASDGGGAARVPRV